MAEANRSIPQIPTIHITRAAHCLAQLRARNAVKDQLRKQGLKVSHYAARDITAMACEYLRDHRSELFAASDSRRLSGGRLLAISASEPSVRFVQNLKQMLAMHEYRRTDKR